MKSDLKASSQEVLAGLVERVTFHNEPPAPKPHQRFVREPKIPIGRAAPNQTAPFPPRGFLLTRLSNAGPAEPPPPAKGRRSRNPSVKLPFALTGPKTTAGKGVFQMAKVVADILPLIAELRPPPVTSTAQYKQVAHSRLHGRLKDLHSLAAPDRALRQVVP